MLRRIVFAGLFVLGCAGQAAAERRVALVLSVESYQHLRPLGNPQNDGRAMEDLLEGLGFEVWTESDRDLRRMRRALEDFREDAAGADLALIFYAGHGVAVDGVNYLLPTDTEAASSERLKETALPLEEVHALLDEVSDAGILLLDACRDDPFAQGAGASPDGRGAAALSDDPPERPKPVPGLGRLGNSDGVVYLFAAAPGATASDGDGKNSPFTDALIRYLGSPGEELKTALTRVQMDVYDRSRGRQSPYMESGLPDLIYISGQTGRTEDERGELLTAMAGLTPELMTEVETVAAQNDMPLAPLYAAVFSGDLAKLSAEERQKKLEEAARSYASFQSELMKFASDDPRVPELRAQAQEQFDLGSTEAAFKLLDQAIEIDRSSRLGIRENYLQRALSEASSHVLRANVARADLRYDEAIGSFSQAAELYAEVQSQLPDREAKMAYITALESLGTLQQLAGNSYGALGAHKTRADYLLDLAKAEPTDVGWTRELVYALMAVGGIMQQQGFLPDAEQSYQDALDFSQWQSERMPDDLDLMYDRVVAQRNLGDVRAARADYPGALTAYGASLDLADLLLNLAPDNVTYLRAVAATHERIGDVQVQLNDFTAARESYDISLQVAQKLANRFPDNQDMRRDLSVALERLGDMMLRENDYDSALAIYMEALRIRDALLALDPVNTLRKRDRAVTLEKIGDIHAGMGDVITGLMSHSEALSIREELTELDPQNAEWLRDMSVSLERIGDLLFGAGDYVSAREAFQKSYDVRDQIVALDPSSLPRQRDLGVALEKLAVTADSSGQEDLAQALYTETLALRRRLVETDPTVQLYRRDLVSVLRNMADLSRRQADYPAEEAANAEVVALLEAITAESPQDEGALRELLVALSVQTDIRVAAGNTAGAVEAGQAALAASERLLQLRPGDAVYLTDRVIAANRLGDAQRAAEDLPGALATFRIMADVAYVLSSGDAWNTGRAKDYALALERIGDVLTRMEEFDAARLELNKAVELRTWIAGQLPGGLPEQRELAISMQILADTWYYQQNLPPGAPIEEKALGIMRWLYQQAPDEVGPTIDLVTALDRMASYAGDANAPLFEEALALLEGLEAQGRLPSDIYLEWMANYRKALGR